MEIKKKTIIILTFMLCVLLILPFIPINISEPHEVMGIIMMLFFVVNPLTTAIINLMIGKDIKKMWWMPILFCIVFLLSYWLVLEAFILDLILYAIIYIIIGIIFMIISWCFTKKFKN